MAITNDSSVSKWAERELRFVEPNIVRMGKSRCDGDNQMPEDFTKRREMTDSKRRAVHLLHDTSTHLFPIHLIARPDHHH